MRTFSELNKIGNACPVCETHDAGEAVLVGLHGTRAGNMMQAEQFHMKCIELLYDKEHDLLYQILPKKEY